MKSALILISAALSYTMGKECITISDVRLRHDNEIHFTSGLGVVDKVWLSLSTHDSANAPY